MTNTIIHVIIDDKFIDMAIREFEICAPGKSRYLGIKTNKPWKHIKSNKAEALEASEIISTANNPNCRAVIFHTLDDSIKPILENITQKKNIVWIGWGYDYYDRLLKPYATDGLTAPKTKKLIRDHPKKHPTSKVIKSKITSFFQKNLLKNHPEKQSLLKITIFSPVIEDEFNIAREYNKWFLAEYMPWNYGCIEDDFHSTSDGTHTDDDNVIVGNSATPTNNHIEAFEHLARTYQIDNKKIVVPLSYGDPWYRDRIIKIGEGFFGSNFIPVVDYMARNDYNKLLSGCSHAIMNHHRQQALGNIVTLILNGSSVHLNTKNPLYSWLNRQGAKICPIITNTPSVRQPLPNLTAKESQTNRQIIEFNFSRRAQREKTKRLCERLLSGD